MRKVFKPLLKIRKENTNIPLASNQMSISDREKINHRQPLHSKRPHDPPVEKKGEENIICLIRTIYTNPSKQTLPVTEKM